ncbi:MAG: sugar phosphate nucleotidyltransferase [Colwellia sp.]
MTSLVILAAGLGSRFGGNKQLAEFGPQQLTLMEYNILNALEAGFTRVVFIIRPEMADLLTQQVISRLPKALTVEVVFQQLDDIPDGCTLPMGRTKPLGTAHAVWCCRHVLTQSFAVINADDFYGKEAFLLLHNQAQKCSLDYAMVAYQVQNTLSEFGGVNRGLCQVNKQKQLIGIKECEQISASLKNNSLHITGIESETKHHIVLEKKDLVSMNCWLFSVDIFNAIETLLSQQIKAQMNEQVKKQSQISPERELALLKQECFLPAVVMQQLQNQKKNVTVLETTESWFGLTYPQDSNDVEEKIKVLF